jgi:membrane-anchored protein YejM (alkaline phosphatase superfamily)
MTNLQKLVRVQKELIKHQSNGHPLFESVYRKQWYEKQQKLKKKIIQLEKKIIEEESAELKNKDNENL